MPGLVPTSSSQAWIFSSVAGSSETGQSCGIPARRQLKSCTSASTSAAVPANGGMNGLVRCNWAIFSRFWSRVQVPVSSSKPLAP